MIVHQPRLRCRCPLWDNFCQSFFNFDSHPNCLIKNKSHSAIPPKPTEAVPRGGSRPSAFLNKFPGRFWQWVRVGDSGLFGWKFPVPSIGQRWWLSSACGILASSSHSVPSSASQPPPSFQGGHFDLKAITFGKGSLEYVSDISSLTLISLVCQKKGVGPGWPEEPSLRGVSA